MGSTIPMPPQLTAKQCELEALQQALAAGEVVKFDAKFEESASIFDWDLDQWKQRTGAATLRKHGFSQRAKKLSHEFIASKKDGEAVSIVEIEAFLKREGLSPVAVFDGQPVTIATLIDEMCRLSGTSIDGIGSEEWSPPQAQRAVDLLDTYAVGNVRTIPGFDFRFPEPFQAWDEIFSFLWMGFSPGGLHFDELDNTLIQLHGTKRVLIYPPELTDSIDGNHYVTSFDRMKPFSQASLGRHKFLRYLPSYVVEIGPGEGVTIPAGAYHSPIATSFDSISINSFLVPHVRKGPFSRAMLTGVPKRGAYPRVVFYAMKASRSFYSLTGRKLIKLGPYELV